MKAYHILLTVIMCWGKLIKCFNIWKFINIKTSKIFQKMYIVETALKTSDGYLWKLKVIHGISFREIHEKNVAVNKETVDK